MTLDEYINGTDYNDFWRLSSGEHQNLLDEAVERIERGEWRSVEDELPNDKEEVLIKHKNYKCYFIGTYYDLGEKWVLRNEIGYIDTNAITHWMPLPKLPNN